MHSHTIYRLNHFPFSVLTEYSLVLRHGLLLIGLSCFVPEQEAWLLHGNTYPEYKKNAKSDHDPYLTLSALQRPVGAG
jgi:hypothetical protein